MKERAKTLADHLSATRRQFQPSPGQDAGRNPAPLPRPQISYFEKECSNLLHESRASLKNLDKISQLLRDVIQPGVSSFKQNLVLSRLSQLSEAEAARRNTLEWEAEHVDKIVAKLSQKSLPSLESLLSSWIESRAKLFQMEKEIQDLTQKEDPLGALTVSDNIVDSYSTTTADRPFKINSVMGTEKRRQE
ncbi:MAG: hypothetical protein WCI18_15455 [Pseudomonadota bacterium]